MHLVPMTIIGLIGSLHRVVPPTPKSVPNRERDSRNCFTGAENRWVQRSFRVGDYVTPTAQVRVRFGTSDSPNDSIVEAGVNHFVVRRIVCP
jgi:hypothetical protein